MTSGWPLPERQSSSSVVSPSPKHARLKSRLLSRDKTSLARSIEAQDSAGSLGWTCLDPSSTGSHITFPTLDCLNSLDPASDDADAVRASILRAGNELITATLDVAFKEEESLLHKAFRARLH